MERMIIITFFVSVAIITQMNAQTPNLVNASVGGDGQLNVVASASSSAHDFDFLSGYWNSANKRLAVRLRDSKEWISSSSTVHNRSFLHGLGNLDVSRTLKQGVALETLSLRVFNPATRLWNSYWVDGQTGVMDAPVVGSFEGAIGTFYGKGVWLGKPVLVMYQWDKTKPDKPEWRQAYSTDSGKTWEWNMVNISSRPEVKPSVFEPGLISTDSSEFGSAFSLDGKMFLFARSINKQSGIFISHKLSTGWSAPERASFSSPDFSDADPAFAPDGSLYFISTRPSGKNDSTNDYDIWKTVPSNGGWSQPANVAGLNSPENEFYISFTASGDAYFSSSRAGGYGEEDIYVSKRRDTFYQTPVNLGGMINSEHSEYDPFVSANGDAIVFTSSGRSDSFGKGDLYYSIKTNSVWTATLHFDEHVNTMARDYCPYVTRDQELFFFSSGGDIKFLSTSHLPGALLSALRK